jgi:hypothetical protein
VREAQGSRAQGGGVALGRSRATPSILADQILSWDVTHTYGGARVLMRALTRIANHSLPYTLCDVLLSENLAAAYVSFCLRTSYCFDNCMALAFITTPSFTSDPVLTDTGYFQNSSITNNASMNCFVQIC